MSAGLLIAVEGPKGVGKTAFCMALATRLSPYARDLLVVTKEPTASFDLESEQSLRGVSLAEAIAADRRTHVAEVIAPALESGQSVVCDRYILSSYVFHVADGVPKTVITRLNQGFPPPSLNLVLHARSDIIKERLRLRGAATRLQEPDSDKELSCYIRYAMLMRSAGTPYETWDNTDSEAQGTNIARLLHVLHLEG